MAVTLTGSLAFTVTQTGTHDFGTPVLPMVVSQALSLSSGTGSNSIDVLWGDSRSLATTSETLDLSGTLTDAFGATVSQVEIRLIYVRHTGTSGVLTIGGAASNQAYAGLVGSATDVVKLGPGGIFFWYSPTDTFGLTVAAGTADKLKIDASASITYEIITGGVSA